MNEDLLKRLHKHELLLFMLHKLGGKNVHQEHVYMEMFNADRGGYSWLTQPNIPDKKNLDSSLARCKSPKYGNDWVEDGLNRYEISITGKGVDKIKEITDKLPALINELGKKNKRRDMSHTDKKQIDSILESETYQKWTLNKISENAWQDVFDCCDELGVMPNITNSKIVKIINSIRGYTKTDRDYSELDKFLSQSEQIFKDEEK
ncbi:hypothetical protein M1N55_02790 [Dehalococcoidia bacterium]|nr:hypothetical protein [Dehalococcoidia bacterium]